MRKGSSPVAAQLRRLAVKALIGLALLYAVAVVGGWAWLRYGRKIPEATLLDVALLRFSEIRRTLGAKHFAMAQAAWDKKDYQAAYLYFSVAVQQDPENLAGRLNAVRFLRAVGAVNPALTLLQEGLARAPSERAFIEETFDLMLASDRERAALDLLHRQYGTEMSGPNEMLLRTFELRATLAVEGPQAARRLLEKQPALAQYPPAVPVLARTLWESSERLKAIELLRSYLARPEATYDDFAQLAVWQEAGGLATDATRTAEGACARFPGAIAARVLRIETHAVERGDDPNVPEVAAFLREHDGQPEALASVALLAGRRGWVEVAMSIYQLAANRQEDLSLPAFCYCDALAKKSRFREVGELLSQLEPQLADGSVPTQLQLRQRQIIAAGALGDTENLREYARRLGALLHGDNEGLEACRRLFQRLGLAAAVAELSTQSLTGAAGARKGTTTP